MRLPDWVKKNLSIKRFLNISSVLSAFLLWYILSLILSPLFVPGPGSVFVGGYHLYKSILLMSILSTLGRIAVGFLLGSIVGIGVAVAMSWNRWIRWSLDPIIEFIRPLPVIALIPLFILWLGLGELPKIIVVAFASFVTLVVNVREAIKNVPSVYEDAAKSLGASSQFKLYKTVLLPAITPQIISGLRIGAAASFDMAAAAEFIGAQRGIGYIIIRAKTFLYTNGLLFGIFLFAFFAFIVNQLIKYFDQRINVWSEREKM